MKKFNRKHIVLSDEDTEAFRIQLESVVERWIDEVSIDGKALVNKARKLIVKHSE